MTTQAEGLIIINARDNASRTMQRFGNSVSQVGDRLTRVGSNISKVTGLLSAFGAGALIGVASVDAAVRKFAEWRQSNIAFEQAMRRANVQTQLSNVSVSQASENFAVMARVLGRQTTTALLQNQEATIASAEASRDLVVTASAQAKALAQAYGGDEAQIFLGLLQSQRGEFGLINEQLGQQIDSQKELADLIANTPAFQPSFWERLHSAVKENPFQFLVPEFPDIPVLLDSFDKAILRPMAGALANWAKNDFPGHIKAMIPDFGILAEGFNTLFIGPALEMAKGLFLSNLPPLWGVGSLFRSTWESAVGWMLNPLNNLGESISNFFNETIPSLWGEDSVLRRSWSNAIGWASGLTLNISKTFKEVFTRIKDTLWDGPASLLRDSWNRFIEWIQDRIDDLRDLLPDPLEGLIPGGRQRNSSLSGGGGGGVVNVIIDGEVIRRVAVDGIRNEFITAGLGRGAFAPGV